MMKGIGRASRMHAAALGILALCALRAPAEESPVSAPVQNETSASARTAESAIRNWPERPRRTARALIEKYGAPGRIDLNDLVWYKNGPWQKTVVYRQAPRDLMRGKDVLEQSISYAVPDAKVAELKKFDDGLKFDKSSGELSSRSESESLNYLALNLADEIVNDKRNAEDARDFYRKTARLAASGKSSAYFEGFIFPLNADRASPHNLDLAPYPAEPFQGVMPDRLDPSRGSPTSPGDVPTPPDP